MSRDGSERAKPPGVVGYLFAELRHAVQDVRQKLVEEGWFGRVVTAKPVVEVHRDLREATVPSHTPDPLGERRPSFDELWRPGERDAPPRRAQEHDIGIDR